MTAPALPPPVIPTGPTLVFQGVVQHDGKWLIKANDYKLLGRHSRLHFRLSQFPFEHGTLSCSFIAFEMLVIMGQHPLLAALGCCHLGRELLVPHLKWGRISDWRFAEWQIRQVLPTWEDTKPVNPLAAFSVKAPEST